MRATVLDRPKTYERAGVAIGLLMSMIGHVGLADRVSQIEPREIKEPVWIEMIVQPPEPEPEQEPEPETAPEAKQEQETERENKRETTQPGMPTLRKKTHIKKMGAYSSTIVLVPVLNVLEITKDAMF